uniref:RxLR effector candidate protein n=1 Tax=Hyaloperonospora arabidopsidis (strain Emoy2) TaxID=559515 RepID=M4C3E4_HYAAE
MLVSVVLMATFLPAIWKLSSKHVTRIDPTLSSRPGHQMAVEEPCWFSKRT